MEKSHNSICRKLYISSFEASPKYPEEPGLKYPAKVCHLPNEAEILKYSSDQINQYYVTLMNMELLICDKLHGVSTYVKYL